MYRNHARRWHLWCNTRSWIWIELSRSRHPKGETRKSFDCFPRCKETNHFLVGHHLIPLSLSLTHTHTLSLLVFCVVNTHNGFVEFFVLWIFTHSQIFTHYATNQKRKPDTFLTSQNKVSTFRFITQLLLVELSPQGRTKESKHCFQTSFLSKDSGVVFCGQVVSDDWRRNHQRHLLFSFLCFSWTFKWHRVQSCENTPS